jgi:hypothetical protein
VPHFLYDGRCMTCGSWRPVVLNRRLRKEICEPCYRARAQPKYDCSICGKRTTAKVRTTDDAPICTPCYRSRREGSEQRTTHVNEGAASSNRRSRAPAYMPTPTLLRGATHGGTAGHEQVA